MLNLPSVVLAISPSKGEPNACRTMALLIHMKAGSRKTARTLSHCSPASHPLYALSFTLCKAEVRWELNDCPRLCSWSLAGSPVIPDSSCWAFFQTRLHPKLGKHFQNAKQNPDSQIFIWFWMIYKLSIFRISLNCLLGHKCLDYTFCQSLLIVTSRHSLGKIVYAYYLFFHTF